MAKKRKLTDKQRLFVEYYLQTWNGTEACRKAGYRGSDEILAGLAYENHRKPHIREAIETRISEAAMEANEVLARLAQQASASITDLFITEHPKLGIGFFLDMEKVKQHGHLIKKIRNTKHGVEIELYDAQAALVHIGRHYGLFTDRVELDVSQELMRLMVEYGLNYDDIRHNPLLAELFATADVNIAGISPNERIGDAESGGGRQETGNVAREISE